MKKWRYIATFEDMTTGSGHVQWTSPSELAEGLQSYLMEDSNGHGRLMHLVLLPEPLPQ